MRKITILFGLGCVLLLLGNALAVDPIELTATVESANFTTPIARINPLPAVTQYNYDAALTNIGIDAPRDDCIWEGSDLTIWVKVLNAGYEIVDCAEVVFTLNGEEFDRVHVTGLHPGEVRKYSATTVAPPPCGADTIAAHVDWPLDENPDNNDIEDIFATGAEADTCLQHDDGSGQFNGWTWLPGYEYPDYAMAAKYQMPFDGVVKYWEFYYTNSGGYLRGHLELFVWAADTSGYPIDYGTGGLYDMEFQTEDVIWPDYGFVCYPICMPVTEDEYYFFGYSNRQNTANFFCHDYGEENPDWNWYKMDGVWYYGSLFDGDFMVYVCLDRAGVMMSCQSLTPVFCRGKNFYFKLIVDNPTGGYVSGVMTFSGYTGYYCDPGNVLINLVRDRTYPPGITETYYYFEAPYAASPGHYSASISGTLAGWDLSCCMNTDIIQCSPFRLGDNDSWQLVEVDRTDAVLPTITELHQNYPNPFNAETSISYTLAEGGYASLKIHDIAGRLVATLVDQHQQAGEHAFTWDASEFSSGVYFYSLSAGEYTSTKKMNLLK
jgi:hypothetical protein